MALTFLYIISGFFFLTFIGLSIYFLYLKLSEKEKPQDKPLIQVLGHKYSEGYMLGVVNDIHFGKRRTKFTYFPRDIDYVAIENNKTSKFIKPISIWVPNNRIKFFGKGEISKRRSFVLIYPIKYEDMNDNLIKSDFGQALIKVLKEKDMKEDEATSYYIRAQNYDKMIKELAELSSEKAVIANLLEYLKEVGKLSQQKSYDQSSSHS